MDIETFLLDLKSLFNDILISGVNYIPMSMLKKLKNYNERAGTYNLFTLNSLLKEFINNDKRTEVFTDISIYLDIAIIEYENMSV